MSTGKTTLLNHMDEPISPVIDPAILDKLPADQPVNPLLQRFPDEQAFAAFAQGKMQDVLGLLQRKGHSYADDSRHEPAWANYEEMAAFTHRTTPEEIVHACLKHLWVVTRWAQDANGTKDIAERITDIIVYLLLLLFWHEYQQAKRVFDPFVKD